MIHESRLCGVDWVKLQYYRFESLGVTDPYLARRLQDCRFSLIEIKGLKEVADSEGVDFLCTAMGDVETLMDYVRFVEPRMLKVREADGRKQDFVDAAVRTGIPCLVSVDPLKGPFKVPARNWRTMFCIPKYPPSHEDFVGFDASEFDGFSSHYPDPKYPVAAWNRAKEAGKHEFYLECHVREDRDNDCLDYPVSLTMTELGRVADVVHENLPWQNP